MLSEPSLTVGEGDTAGETYTVALGTAPTGNVTVAITGHDGTDLSLDRDQPDLHHRQLEHGDRR